MTEPETPPPSQPPTKQEIIRQIAQALTEKRKLRNLTLANVSQHIKIRTFYLDALEKGNWAELPGEVYIRGFIRRYAQFLGMDGHQLVAPYIACQNGNTKSETPTNQDAQGNEISGTFWVWVGVITIGVLGLFKFILVEPSAAKKKKPSVVDTATAVPTPPSQIKPVSPDDKTVFPDKHRLDVVSPFPLWMRVSATNKSFEGFITQGTTWTWRGEGPFSVRIGHTKEVRLFFDGKQVPLGENQKALELPLEGPATQPGSHEH